MAGGIKCTKVGFVTSVICLALVVLPGLLWGILTPVTSRQTSGDEELGLVWLWAGLPVA